MNAETDILARRPPDLTGIKPDIQVAFILCSSFTMLPFAAFVDSLRHAADEADHSRQIYCTWKILAEDCSGLITASCGSQIRPQEPLGGFDDLDYVVVVGGLLPQCLALGEKSRRWIRDAYDAGVSIVGLCTGSFILAEIGLLKGRQCAVHTEHIGAFHSLFPDALASSTEIYINDRAVLTCPGGTSALDLAFHLIETHCGVARAVKGLNSLLIEKYRSSRRFRHRPHGHLAACGNSKVEAAVEIMEKHIMTPYPIRELATKVNCSERELCRLFRKYGKASPSEAWRTIRLEHAHWMLLNSNRTITQVAYESGFADSSHFTRWFRSTYKQSPAIYRRQRRRTEPLVG